MNRLRQKPWLGLALMSLLVTVLSFLLLGIGSVFLKPGEIVAALQGDGAGSFIVWNYRLPRTLLAFLAGGCFALSGVLLQAIIRNPLVSPDVIGVTNGAALFAVLTIALIPDGPLVLTPLAALIGATLVMVALMLLADHGKLQNSSFALLGIAVSAICASGTEYLLIKFPLQTNDSLVWLAGSLFGKGWTEVYVLAPVFLLLGLVIWSGHRQLDILSLSEDAAIGLGLRMKGTRYVFLALAVALAGVAVAMVGSIGFLGLVAPHMARRLIGHRHHLLIPMAVLVGGGLLVVADALGRGIHPPLEIPAGLITAIIGVPYFLYLLRKERA
ncbi:iron ABC transporter permease [Exiguobacterium sp. RIT452]|uniref:FecCD family ABC transporter permease n=1 Tax=Exiguobacterium sp. RIT452 TaxID=2315552 RepID=UPI000E71E6CD|nr:iron chelate uptake ABC transporter family permease subunit [Exiguobacterium sp. RIT452]RJP02478.1 iron ABC transporter permease [Exiguobacterium sp. RIT452]